MSDTKVKHFLEIDSFDDIIFHYNNHYGSLSGSNDSIEKDDAMI